MALTKMIPKVYYSDIRTGLELFVDALGFHSVYSDGSGEGAMHILQRDNLTIQIVQDDEYARKDRPEIRIETDDIDGCYLEVKNRNSGLLHPNLPIIKMQPWGLREFALLDKSHVCIIVQQPA